MMAKVNYKHPCYEDGSEDLDGTMRQAILNVRVLTEQEKWDFLDAAEHVSRKMNLTYAEYLRLQTEAIEHYMNRKD